MDAASLRYRGAVASAPAPGRLDVVTMRTRDRLFSRPVARAMWSPLGVGLAAGVAAVGMMAGFPLVFVAGAGMAVWAARVALAVPRGLRADGTDPVALREPWRGLVEQARASRGRYLEAVDARRRGPLHDQLGSLDDRITMGVQESWRVALAGQALGDALALANKPAILTALTQLNWDADGPPKPGTTDDAARLALEEQLASVQRVEQSMSDTQNQLRMLNARLDQAVTHAIELSIRSSLDGVELGQAVDSVLAEMETLTVALDEVDVVDAIGSGSAEGVFTESPHTDIAIAASPATPALPATPDHPALPASSVTPDRLDGSTGATRGAGITSARPLPGSGI